VILKSNPEMLTQRFVQAFELAYQLHAEQIRKGTETPYLAHLMGVAALVLENGGDEDLAIAALLHDAVEDQGGLETLEIIRQQFGERVAAIVDGCSDTYVIPKPAWRNRKEQYLEHLKTTNSDVHLVSLADKLHNARTLLFDLQQFSMDVWERFTGGKSGSLWYYRRLADYFLAYKRIPMSIELDRIVSEIERLASQE
jgi:(p)ppGpp synthase/HD superfamily hydrolase